MGSYHHRHAGRQTPTGARFTVGRDHHGWWVVQDRLERVGGYFVSEEAARHFAAEEAGHDTSAICTAATEVVELFDKAEHSGSIGRSILDNNSRLTRLRTGSR